MAALLIRKEGNNFLCHCHFQGNIFRLPYPILTSKSFFENKFFEDRIWYF